MILNDTVWCKLGVSPTHGVGVIAIRNIKKGTMISDYSYADLNKPKTIFDLSEEEFMTILPEIRTLILDRMLFEERFIFISPNADQNLRSFMNHADDANSDGIYALRDIATGEEVTQDYRQFVKEAHVVSKKHYDFIEWG